MQSRAAVWIAVVVATGIVGLTQSAWAQDYTVTTATGKLEARPAGATVYTITDGSLEPARSAVVQMPFPVPYYGSSFQEMTVTAYGFVVPHAAAYIHLSGGNQTAHGQDSTSGAFPYTPSATGGTGDTTVDGLLAPLWSSLTVNSQLNVNGRVYTWTSGTAPTRHFVVSWDSVKAVAASTITVQLHLYEGTGQIVFAYSTTGTYPVGGSTGSGYVCGIDSPIDNRYTAPLLNAITNSGNPGSDFIFDPRLVTFTGTLLYDRLVTTASGLGGAVATNTPLDGVGVELQRSSDGLAYARGITAANGSFSVTGYAIPSGTGYVAAAAANRACSVGPTTTSAPTRFVFLSSQSFANNAALGTFDLGASGDANGDLRAAIDIARSCGRVYAWASTRTTDIIPTLAVAYDPASSLLTTYVPAGGPTPAYMTVGSGSSANPDGWDEALVARTYGRHVLASITAGPLVGTDERFDAVTNIQNAFACGFGYYLWAVTSGTSTAIDGTSAIAATVYDLETPALTVTPGDDVAGSMAGALYDLVDPANETSDTVDGTLATDRVFRVVDSMTASPSQATFRQAWIDAGWDAVGITRGFVGNKALRDDAAEPNDAIGESASIGTIGVLRRALVLNSHNEDWFSFSLPTDAAAVMADAKYDQLTTGADVAVEIRTAGGALVATGTLLPLTSAVHTLTGPLAAGSYRLGVRHVSGGTVPTYDLQVYLPPLMDTEPVKDWTLGRPYDQPLGAAGGVAPYLVSVLSGALPDGIVLDAANARAFGTPTQVGTYSVAIRLVDSGSPANVVQRSESVTIHDVLKIGVARFVGFPAARAVDTTLPTIEGTPPFTLTMTTGALPDGLAIAPGSFHVTGNADPQSSTTLELDGVDVAGSVDHITTRAVVAAATDLPNAPTDLAAGDDACGWWFDAVQGSAVSFKAKTAKGRVKRLIAAAVLAPDRSEVLTAKVKGKLGGLSVSKLVCPLSGRYYVIAASSDGEATQLLGSVAVNPPKSGKAKLVDFTQTDTTTVELGALPGATLTLKFKGDKKRQLTPKVVALTDPDGAPVLFGGNVVVDGVAGTFTMTFAKGGTWTVVLGATSANGTPGKLSYSYKLAQPKDATYSAD